ncbi:hypothetical protein Rsub_11217 [Raphidocelis subcapitata]|uniref:Uncharacterized protein n=1 Tax=Raphidocelis subcapitata TaxID=307507 RepID=A0A2V0PAG1_9CHLO|nr:hypothetical protein Rsub_07144 [Raphidocelis subcapitata]GBF97867.1 hypothetical protein Rsub_11217 [Raphidocelis subcapitata]|eukprot:GBF94157.1 hypothetical protein Rsub_07144 [Raphidocelis subcapitata]
MAKLALSLALLAVLVLGSEAATSFNSLCRQAGKPTKFKGKLTNSGKNVGFAQYCFVNKLSGTGYTRVKVNGVQDLRAVNFYTGTAPAASDMTVTADTNITFEAVDTGNAYFTSSMNAISQVTGAGYIDLNVKGCAGQLFAGIVVGPVGAGVNQPASSMAKKSGNGC